MKLISMHVDNFGGLHDYDYVFHEGLNVVLHDNGWGKTTMAAFLKAMLYGYDTRRSKDITENERKRYLPWQGGKYGGSLDFEAEGKRYRIYRTFGETPRFDTAKIIDLDTSTTARIPADRIGETLFHLDASAFQRSVFINQNGLSIDGAASSIHTRLNTLVSQANDVAAFDGAIAQLTQQIKIYEKTGARGRLGDITRQIAEQESFRTQLEREIAAQDNARERIVQINDLLDQITRELEEKTKKLEAAAGEGKRQEAAQEMLADINARIAAFQQQLNAIQAELGGSVPTSAEIDQMKQADQTRGALTEKLGALDTEHAKLVEAHSTFLARYGKGLPSTHALNEIQRLHSELQGLLNAGAPDLHIDEAPEEYSLITDAMAAQDDYVPQLQSAIRTSAQFQELQQQIKAHQSGIQRETENWKNQAHRYAAMRTEQEMHAAKLDEMAAYRPSEVESAIEALQACVKQHTLLGRQEATLQTEIQLAERSRDEARTQHQELSKRVTELQTELDHQRCYTNEQVRPVIAALEETQRLIQRTEDLQATAPAHVLTAEESALLQSYPAELPDASECNDMLNQHRQSLRHRAEVQGLVARLQGEASKRDSLQSSLAQLDASVAAVPKPVAAPKKAPGRLLIGTGIALVILGVILAALLAPVLGAAAVAGILLVIVGVSTKRNGQKQAQAWRAYQKETEQHHAALQQQQLLRQQLTEVQHSVEALQTQVAQREQEITASEAVVAAWISRWEHHQTDDAESAIHHIMEQAGRIRQLHEKEAAYTRLQAHIQEQTAKAIASRAEIDQKCPVIAALSCNEAIAFLHEAHTRQQLTFDQLEAARQRLNKFLADAKKNGFDPSEETSSHSAELRQRLHDIAEKKQQIAANRAGVDARYPEIAGLSIDDALSLLQKKLQAYRLEESQLNTATRNLESFLRSSGYTSDELMLDQSPRVTALAAACSTTVAELEALMQQANILLKPLDLDTDAAHMAQALSEANAILNVYLQHRTRLADAQARQHRTQQLADSLRQQIAEHLTAIGVRASFDELLPTLADIRQDISQTEQLQEKTAAIANQHASVKAELQQIETLIDRFCTDHGHFDHVPDGLLAAIFEKAAAYAEMTAAMQPLQQQCASIAQTQQQATEQAGADEIALRSEVAALKEKREALLIEYTQHSDAIRQADRALEKYPDVCCAIRQLYEQKQHAQQRLAVLKRTIQLITAAKENLAARYLSKVEQLFNSYMQIWLKNDAIRGVLDIDFNVSIAENDKVHVAQGYSSGYCDMIDFCMRLALVDTLFEKEQPFLILDDPFVNLDTSRLENALELLNMMAAEKQIVYFICHPIRAVETTENAALRSQFMQLAENTRKNAAASRGASMSNTTAVRKSPKEMYHVCETAASQAIRPANPRYTITNSIFSMNFVAGETASAQDYCLELFFIDTAGRVLNDRQMIEVISGKLSAERIQFNLNTRDDSGDTFELMIRQSGHDDYELAARYPFRAKLAFTGTFSFDL